MEDNNKDRRELLMVKQNPEEYRDNVFRDAKEKYAKQRTKNDDRLYYAKWIIIIGGIAVLFLVFLIIQITSRTEDIRIALVSYDHHFEEYSETLEALFGNYTPDFNKNKEVDILMRTIDLTGRDTLSQYSMSESEKLATEMRSGVIQAVISDEEFYEYANSGMEDGGNVFLDMSSQFPEFALYQGCGIRLRYVFPNENETAMQLPDDLILYIRTELPNYNNSDKAAQYRNEAMTIVKNIAEKMAMLPE